MLIAKGSGVHTLIERGDHPSDDAPVLTHSVGRVRDRGVETVNVLGGGLVG